MVPRLEGGMARWSPVSSFPSTHEEGMEGQVPQEPLSLCFLWGLFTCSFSRHVLSLVPLRR